MEIKECFLTSKKARPRTKRKKTTKIAIHWVGNANSTAMNNRNYFNNGSVSASSHYIVGLDGEILYCVPEDEIAYTTNSANSYSIGIENCHSDWTGKFNSKTYNSLVELCAYLCKKYKLNPLNDLIRHYDVTKKCCPKWFVEHPSDWVKFKQDVKNKMNGVSQIDTNDNKYINGTYNCEAKVVSDDGLLSIRDSRPKNNKLGNKIGEFKTNDIVHVGYCLDNWFGVVVNGKQGFISGDYVRIIKKETPSNNTPFKNGNYDVDMVVTASALNIRKGRPNQSNYSTILGQLKQGQTIKVGYCLNNWFSIYIDGVCNPGFICGDYLKLK